MLYTAACRSDAVFLLFCPCFFSCFIPSRRIEKKRDGRAEPSGRTRCMMHHLYIHSSRLPNISVLLRIDNVFAQRVHKSEKWVDLTASSWCGGEATKPILGLLISLTKKNNRNKPERKQKTTDTGAFLSRVRPHPTCSRGKAYKT